MRYFRKVCICGRFKKGRMDWAAFYKCRNCHAWMSRERLAEGSVEGISEAISLSKRMIAAGFTQRVNLHRPREDE